jgi:hypothetical protein
VSLKKGRLSPTTTGISTIKDLRQRVFFFGLPAFFVETPSYPQTTFTMKLGKIMTGLALILVAGCDTMDQDVDGSTLSINNQPAYFLDGGGVIDLTSRIIGPGKIRVEITTSTQNGELKDLGKGLLQYSPFKGSTKDFFRFRVLSDNNGVLADDSIGIIIPTDTTTLPCKYVYTRNDSVPDVTGSVLVDVTANDWSCSGSLSIAIDVAPLYGTATVVGNEIRYVPNGLFPGHDQLLYKATSSDPSLMAGYALVWFNAPDTTSRGNDTTTCQALAIDDLFYKAATDTTSSALDVLANDVICDTAMTVMIAQSPHYGKAYFDSNIRKIWYRSTISHDDTLKYQLCQAGGCSYAKVVVKRN